MSLTFVRVKRLTEAAKLPRCAYNSAGYDVWPCFAGTILPGKSALIQLGFALEFENGYAAIVDDRSSTGKAGLTHLAGVIDADYRGECCILMFNLGTEPYAFSPAKAIAQLLFVPVARPLIMETTGELTPSARDTGKFGSSGH